jgi:hypothetical protein
MSAPVKGSDALPADGVVVVVVPNTLGAAMEKFTVTVCDDVAPPSTSVCAPGARSVGTVKEYATVPVDEAVAGVSVSGTE